ncbi:MAG: hypothetical protein RLP44_08635 [Aggregatilineales bacterium]
MTSIQGIIILKIGLWLIYISAFFRARARGTFATQSARRIWLLFFLWNIAFTLWGDETEIALNQFFSGMPLALFIKSGCMLLTFYLYYLLLKPVRPSRLLYGFLDLLCPIMMVIGAIWYVFYGASLMGDYSNQRFLVIGIRDFVMTIYAIVIFIPYTLIMLSRERHAPMKVKQTAALTCFCCYLIVASAGMAAGITAQFGHADVEQIARTGDPAVYIGLIAFMVTMIPYRWLEILFQARRMMLYWKLRRLEQYVTRDVDARLRPPIFQDRVVKPENLELVLYQLMISILDHYHLIEKYPRYGDLYQQLEAIQQMNYSYPTLLRRLAMVKL